ncbi:MAG: hypothetical protein VX898_02730, partial [Candidatus Thermoplasmatota archaeon]|nr:hypothetical protein [Candidatus Thermoplasmatota archaeon]
SLFLSVITEPPNFRIMISSSIDTLRSIDDQSKRCSTLLNSEFFAVVCRIRFALPCLVHYVTI